MKASPILLIAACALLTLAACNSTDEPSLSAEEEQRMLEVHIESAQQYLFMGELARAEGQALKGLEIDPDNEKLKLIRGWALQRRGRTADILAAEQVFRELEDSEDFRVSLGLAEVLERKGVAYDEAAENIRSGKRVSQAADPVARADELAREARKAWEEALVNYEKTLKQRPQEINTLNGAMRTTALLGREEASVGYADRLIESAHGDLEFWKKQLQRQEINADEEERFRANVRKLSELEVATHLHASTLLHELKRDEEALAHLDLARMIDPELPEIQSRRAELLQDLGRYSDAIAEVDGFLRISHLNFDHPDIRRAWRLRTECEEALRTASAQPPRAP